MATGKPDWIKNKESTALKRKKYLLWNLVALLQKRISSLLAFNSLLQMTIIFEKLLLRSQNLFPFFVPAHFLLT